jgi:nucleoside-diphosphate-sugar epimerase
LQAQSPYSATKIAADRLAESFHRSFNLPVTIVRPFNTFGPRQSARAVIPTLITQLLNGEAEVRLGAVSPTRDFNYVTDTVNGFIAIAESDQTAGEEINIASGRECGIGALAQLLIDRINPNARIVTDEERVRPATSEVERLVGDNSKLMTLTRWRSSHTLEQGLDETVDWFRNPENLARYKSWLYNV